jgi:DNA (cytosine-5)-methyltransferase 1
MNKLDNTVYAHRSQPLRIGTDCSGIEAPIQALRQLGIPHRHVWSSDIDKYCIQSIKSNYEPEILFGDPDGPYTEGDITKRDVSLLPDIDLYICGFPCQPFSNAGKRKGFDDVRGNVFFSCLEVIKTKQPTYFILENVKGLIHHDKGNTWKVILNELEQLKKIGYNVKWKILNTRDYGIPQNRERVYLVGTKGKEFKWPTKVKMRDVHEYIDNTDKKKQNIPNHIQKSCLFDKIPNDAVFIDFGFRYFSHPKSNNYTPCLTASHVRQMWNVHCHRQMNIKEAMRLQGFDIDFKQSVSNTQLKKQIGNSMSVNVVKELLLGIL